MSGTSTLAKEIAAELLPLVLGALREVIPPPNECMTVRQIARHLRLGDSKVRALIEAGTLPRVPDIKEARVRRSEVDRFGTERPTK